MRNGSDCRAVVRYDVEVKWSTGLLAGISTVSREKASSGTFDGAGVSKYKPVKDDCRPLSIDDCISSSAIVYHSRFLHLLFVLGRFFQ